MSSAAWDATGSDSSGWLCRAAASKGSLTRCRTMACCACVQSEQSVQTGGQLVVSVSSGHGSGQADANTTAPTNCPIRTRRSARAKVRRGIDGEVVSQHRDGRAAVAGRHRASRRDAGVPPRNARRSQRNAGVLASWPGQWALTYGGAHPIRHPEPRRRRRISRCANVGPGRV
jgi:hypothetical protein